MLTVYLSISEEVNFEAFPLLGKTLGYPLSLSD